MLILTFFCMSKTIKKYARK